MHDLNKTCNSSSSARKKQSIHLDALCSPRVDRPGSGRKRSGGAPSHRVRKDPSKTPGVTVTFLMEEIFGQSPQAVVKLFHQQGIDPTRPYSARFSFRDVIIEQD